MQVKSKADDSGAHQCDSKCIQLFPFCCNIIARTVLAFNLRNGWWRIRACWSCSREICRIVTGRFKRDHVGSKLVPFEDFKIPHLGFLI